MEANKKIGLLTFHTPDNYGAVYQAYALQTYIQKTLGKEIEIINFYTQRHIDAYSIFKKKSNNPIKNIILQLITLKNYFKFKEKKNKFKVFREKFLTISKKRYYSEEEFLQHEERYHTYLVGSDQVFNPNNKYLKTYYLAFPKNGCRKIAYAPSFGISNFNDEITNKILPYVKDFDKLSCREQQGAEYLTKILGCDIKSVVDPVYLIGREAWENIAINPKETEKYLFIYDLAGGERLIELANKIASRNNLKIICATTQIKKKYKNCDIRLNIGPRELLGYIKNAEFVVTDSFHGTSLSLIMRKKLITYIALPHAASRITSIMNNLGTSNQIVTNIADFNLDKIIFNNYDDKLEALVLESKKYLETSLS